MARKKVDTKETLIAQIMAECERDGEPVTRAEAEEMAEMEIKSGEVAVERTESKPRKPRKAPDKDPEKVELIKKFYDFLVSIGEEDVFIANEQKEVDFRNYTISLIKHSDRILAKRKTERTTKEKKEEN